MTLGSRVLAAVAAGSVLFAGACTNSTRKTPAEPMRVKVLEGTVTVFDASGSRRVQDSARVAVGDKIVLSGNGIADLTLADGVQFELAGARVVVNSGRKITLETGNVLAMAAGPVAVKTDPITVRSDKGVFRVDRALSTRVAVYQDEARIDGPSLLPIPTYNEAVVSAGLVGRATTPLQIDPTDRWDLRFLKDAIDVDARLLNLSRGLEAQLAAYSGPDFYRRVLPMDFEVGLLTPLSGDRKTDVLIGSVIVYEAAQKGTAQAELMGDVFSMWRAGASWGLVAHRFGVAQQVLFDLLLESVNKSNIVDQGRGTALAAGPRKPSPGPTTKTSPSPRPVTPSPHPEPSAQPTPAPSPTPGVLAPVTDLLDQVVQDLLGGLLTPPSPTPKGGDHGQGDPLDPIRDLLGS